MQLHGLQKAHSPRVHAQAKMWTRSFYCCIIPSFPLWKLIFCSIKFTNRDICRCDSHPTCPHAKNLIRTWLFGSSKCVKFRKIIFNCTIQITEEVKRCTSCLKQQDSPVINTSSVASHQLILLEAIPNPFLSPRSHHRFQGSSWECSYSEPGAGRRRMSQNCPFWQHGTTKSEQFAFGSV